MPAWQTDTRWSKGKKYFKYFIVVISFFSIIIHTMKRGISERVVTQRHVEGLSLIFLTEDPLSDHFPEEQSPVVVSSHIVIYLPIDRQSDNDSHSSHTGSIALSSPCHLKSSVTHWCSSSVAEWPQGHPACLDWTLRWRNSWGWRDKRSKRCHATFQVLIPKARQKKKKKTCVLLTCKHQGEWTKFPR